MKKSIFALVFLEVFIILSFCSPRFDFPQNVAEPYIRNSRGVRVKDISQISFVSGFSISRGLCETTTSIYKFGRNSSVGTSEEIIWDSSSAYYWLSTAEILTIASTDNNDKNGDTGAWNVKIFGLDEDWKEISEIVVLNGTTPVNTTKKYIRINRGKIVNAGSSGINEGTISLYHTTISNKVMQINPNCGQTQMAIYSVPDCKVAHLLSVSAGLPDGKSAIVCMKTRINYNNENPAWNTRASRDIFATNFQVRYVTPRVIPPRTDIVMTGITTVSTVSVSASFEFILTECNGEYIEE